MLYLNDAQLYPLNLSTYHTLHVTSFELLDELHIQMFGCSPTCMILPYTWSVYLSDYMSTQFNSDDYYNFWDKDYAQIGMLTIKRVDNG